MASVEPGSGRFVFTQNVFSSDLELLTMLSRRKARRLRWRVGRTGVAGGTLTR